MSSFSKKLSHKKLAISLAVIILSFSLVFIIRVAAISIVVNQTYGGPDYDYAMSLVETVDGYAIGGYTGSFGAGDYDFWLVKTDVDGNEVWNKTYGGPEIDVALSLVKTSDGGYAMAGYTQYDDFWVVKTDVDGNEVWNKTYGGEGGDNAQSLVVTSDGGFAIAGVTNSFGAGMSDFWLVKTDVDGNIEWNRTYGGPESDYIFSLVEASDGGYVLAGGTESFGVGDRDVWLIKTDVDGNEEWSRTYGGTNDDYAMSLAETVDGYAIAGGTDSFGAGKKDAWLIKIDLNGNEVWNKTYGGPDGDYVSSLVETVDGYVLAGHTESFGAGDADAWLVKIDAYGNIEWNYTYGEAQMDRVQALVKTSDGGYAMAGYTESFGAGEADFWLTKIFPSTPPVSMFSYSPVAPAVQQEILFNASSSYDLDEDILSYLWDFSDGNITTTTNPEITHTFELPRDYNVTLTVIDNEELNSTKSQSILVKIHSAISFSTDTNTTYTGEPIEFTGKLIDAYGNGLSNENISIYYATTGNENWTPIKNITTDSIGNYVSTWTNSNPRTWVIKIEWAGNQTFYGTSNTTTIQFLQHPTLLSLSLSSTSTQFGFKVGINGELTSNDVGLVDFPIHLSYSVTEGQSWNDISLTRTDSQGKYSVEWLPSATGIYIVKAFWEGNSSYPRNEVTANLAVISFEDESIFSVASNSTVSGLVFNSTSKELKFTLSGTTGTTGYVETSISKTLILDINEVQVYLDNIPVDFEYSSLEDSWLIFFDYSHSTHEVTIYLNPSSIPFDGSNGNGGLGGDMLPIVLVLSVIVVCGILVYFVIRRKGTA